MITFAIEFESWDPNKGNEEGDVREWGGKIYYADADIGAGVNPEAGGAWKLKTVAGLLEQFSKALISKG